MIEFDSELMVPMAIPDLYSPQMMLPQVNTREFFERIDLWESYDVFPRYLSAPVIVLWEITAACPLNCPYCYNNSPKRVQELTTDELFRLAREIVDMKVFGACITGGEPTGREEFPGLVRTLAEGGVLVNVTSNGWYMTKELAEELARYATAVTISLDGGSAEVHDRERKRRGSFDRAVQAIRHLKEAGVRTLSSFACTSTNVRDFPNVVALCYELGVELIRTHPLAITGKASLHPQVGTVSVEEYTWLTRWIEEYMTGDPERSSRMMVQWIDPSIHIRIGRHMGRALGARITAEGHYAFTGYLPYVMGNARRQSLREVWEAGMREAWRHPVVREKIAGIQSITDLRLSGSEGIHYLELDPRLRAA